MVKQLTFAQFYVILQIQKKTYINKVAIFYLMEEELCIINHTMNHQSEEYYW